MCASAVLCALSALGGVTKPHRRWAASPAIPLSDPRLGLPRNNSVQQVHVDSGYPDEAWIVWVTAHYTPTSLQYKADDPGADWVVAKGTAEVYSSLLSPDWHTHPTLPTDCIGEKNYTNPDCYYTSGKVHRVLLTGLRPSTRYIYVPYSSTVQFSFKTLPAVGPDAPLRLGVVGDLGQSSNSTETVDGLQGELKAGRIDGVLFAGDLSYADGYQPRWDSYARLFEPMWSSVATTYTGGNHEFSNGPENWQSYRVRYPNSYTRSDSESFLWYSVEMGPLHVITMCSYAEATPGSIQYDWLRRDLASVNRTRTPWLVAMFHVPWWTSNAHHSMVEGARMKASMEQLLVDAKVDLVLTGHVHAYERTHPVQGGGVDCRNGIPHITIGDGGNREHFAVPWAEPQPDWSALREYAYGFGRLTFHNSSVATWEWMRNDDPWNPPKESGSTFDAGDEYVIRHAPRGSGC